MCQVSFEDDDVQRLIACSVKVAYGQNPAPAATPAPAAAAPTAAAPPATPPPIPEMIFPNLEGWKKSLQGRIDLVKKFIVPDKNQYEDQEILKIKKIAGEIMKSIEDRLKDKKVMSGKNQRAVANQLSDLEEKLTNAGRRLFGIRWNSLPCGAGFVQSNCGQLRPCE